MSYDYLIVGAGFTGATMARCLADIGKRVLIIDKRDHIGGNAYDYVNEHGVRVHKYGPHIFHTNSDKVFAFLSRFTEWRAYEHRVLSNVNGKLVPFPINLDTLEMLYGRSFSTRSAMEFLAARVAHDWHGGEVVTAEDQIVSQVGRELFELFFAGYTKKMWGVEAKDLDKSVTARIPVRFDRDSRYFTDRFQAMPKDGYTALFERMLDHENIDLMTGMRMPAVRFDRLPGHPVQKWPEVMKFCGERCEHMIWTAPIDKFFNEGLGALPYMSMQFSQLDLPRSMNDWPPGGAATMNYPDPSEPATRATNMGRLSDHYGEHGHTEIVRERPTCEGEPYYPIPSPESDALYKQYAALAAKEAGVTFLGRLGRYQYLNMDQAVGQALVTFERMAKLAA